MKHTRQEWSVIFSLLPIEELKILMSTPREFEDSTNDSMSLLTNMAKDPVEHVVWNE